MKRNTLYLVTMLLMPMSCSYLDRQPADFITPDEISVESDIKWLLNGTYAALSLYKQLPVSLDYITDNGYCNDPNCGENVYWRMAQTPADTRLTMNLWSRDYAGILRANAVLHYAPLVVYSSNAREQFTKGPERRENHMAQAKALRAYFYLDLIDHYGDCPMRLLPEGIDKIESPRVSKEEILSNILLDLDEAIAFLPEEYTNPNYTNSIKEYGRITKGAALAIKARASLYFGQYQWCIDACRQIIAMKRYELEPFSHLFTEAYERNKEYIMTIQYIPDHTAEGISAIWWSRFNSSSQYQISYNLADDFYMLDGKPSSQSDLFSWNAPYANRDPRLYYTMERYASGEKEVASIYHTGLKLKKFVSPNPENIANNDGQDFPLIRYADVLLMLAEALIETEGDVFDYDEVCSLVNQIRTRPDVDMPTIAACEEAAQGRRLSVSQLRSIVRHERRVELAMEGLRMSDIRRWGIGPEAYSDCYAIREDGSGSYKKILFATRTFDTAKGYLWPIPSIEVQRNPIPNNPGYYD